VGNGAAEVEKMIERIPQRSKTDCAICVVTMVMGPLYSYERVLRDSEKYPKMSEDGKFSAWWETYLQDEGFLVEYRPFMELYSLPYYGGRMMGLLGFDIPQLQYSHIVAVDELGIIDPADDSPPHTDIAAYVLGRINNEKAVFHPDFLAVVNPKTVNFC
jgi:hypothetical protein